MNGIQFLTSHCKTQYSNTVHLGEGLHDKILKTETTHEVTGRGSDIKIGRNFRIIIEHFFSKNWIFFVYFGMS